MAAQRINDTETSPYAVLGVSRHATAEEIKRAYHHKAKEAHPDAGGSVAEMARINAAYQLLHDQHRRWEYDTRAETPESHEPPAESARSHPKPEPEKRPRDTAFTQEAATQAAQRQASRSAASAQVELERAAWAKTHTMEMLRFTAVPALVAGLVEWYMGPVVEASGPRIFFDLAMFIPVFALCVCLAFMADPKLRLVFGDIARRYPTSPEEKAGALAVVVSFIPLAALWTLVFRLQ